MALPGSATAVALQRTATALKLSIVGRKLDSYAIANLTARMQLGASGQLNARIENLFDEAYEDVIGFNTPGIGAFVGVQVKSGR